MAYNEEERNSNSTTLQVAYLGPEASFSHQAALELFPDASTATLHPLPSFSAIFEAIEKRAISTNTNTTETKHVSTVTNGEHDNGKDNEFSFDLALLPLENSTNGSVVQVLDLLIQCNLNPATARYPSIEIIAEHYLQVHHCLLVSPKSLPGDDDGGGNSHSIPPISSLNITTLYTHPQVWGQCGKFLAKNFDARKVERIDMASTSKAAEFVASSTKEGVTPSNKNSCKSSSDNSHQEDTENGSIENDPKTQHHPLPSTKGIPAAIASTLAAQRNNLITLASNIEDSPGSNTTKFIVIKNRHKQVELSGTVLRPSQPTTTTNVPSSPPRTTQTKVHKSLILFTIPHTKPGALASALTIFTAHDFNLTAIQTRPSGGESWHYVFFVECELGQRRHHTHTTTDVVFTENDDNDDDELGSTMTQTGMEKARQKIKTMMIDLARVTEDRVCLGIWSEARSREGREDNASYDVN